MFMLLDFLLPPPVLQSIPTKSLKRSFDFNLSPGSIILKQSNICSEYQHMMFKMVSKILENQELIIAVNKQPHSNLTVKQLETIAEYKDFLKYLEDDSVRLGLVKQLSFLGAKDYKQLIRLVMNRLFTNTLLAQFNLKGSGGKIGLLSTKLYDVLEELKEYCRQSTINLLGDELIHYFI
nr:uncharacterized protein LOC124817748 isoform X3 [Hydra vulgaris]